MLKKVKAVLLIIRDGWGEAPTDTDDRYNALRQAKAPCALALKQQWPHTTLKTCGRDVGLPEGIMGNSEVGHQNIGAGRIVLQERVRLDAALGKLQVENTAALEALKKYATHGRVHLMGLLSDGGVHSALAHLYALVAILKNAGLTSIFIHGFTDGRDTPPQSALGYVQALETQLTQLGAGTLASLCGRFYAMDRDERWDRVQKAYTMLTGDATSSQSPQEALKAYYLSAKDPVSDEFLPPLRFAEGDSRIQDGDAVVFFNFHRHTPISF